MTVISCGEEVDRGDIIMKLADKTFTWDIETLVEVDNVKATHEWAIDPMFAKAFLELTTDTEHSFHAPT
eukprot:12407088-Karenia_brevis.AAC.1